jgi:hypothetical protein
MSKKTWFVVLVVVALAAMPIVVRAADAGAIVKTGSLFADTGGASNSWVIEIPAGDVVEFTLKQTNFPCLPGPEHGQSVTPRLGAFGLKVSQWDKTSYSNEVGTAGCLQKLYYTWPDGGPATVEVYNYYEGSTADYELTIEGAVAAAAAPVVAPVVAPAGAAEVVVPAAEPKTGRAE